MISPIAAIEKFLLAKRALVWLLASVLPLVTPQVVAICITFVAINRVHGVVQWVFRVDHSQKLGLGVD